MIGDGDGDAIWTTPAEIQSLCLMSCYELKRYSCGHFIISVSAFGLT